MKKRRKNSKIRLKHFLLLVLVLYLFDACKAQTSQSNDSDLKLLDGFRSEVIADSLGFSRQLAVLPNGDLFIVGRKSHIIENQTGNYKKTTFSGIKGAGVQTMNDYVYVSTSTDIFRYDIRNLYETLEPDKEILMGGFSVQPKHGFKTFSIDSLGNIYVNLGAPSNICEELDLETDATITNPNPCPQLDNNAGIWKFSISTLNQKPEDGIKYATGIRNAVAIDWNNKVNKLYVVQHGRDRLNDKYPELYSEKDNANDPAEEFLVVEEGDKFGWPYCYLDYNTQQKILSPEYGVNKKLVGICADFKDPLMGFPAHYSPNDLIFYYDEKFPEKYHNAAFIAFHGSWNRAPLNQKSFNLVVQPMGNDGMPKGEWEVFADGFAGKDIISSPGEVNARPCGLAQDKKGNLCVLDSMNGKLWRIWYEDSLF